MRSIDELEVGGVVNVKSTNVLTADEFNLDIGGVGNTDLELRCDQLDVEASMVGNLTLRGEVQEANIKNGGVGSLKALDLKVDRLTIKNSGVGSAEVQAMDEISITSSGVSGQRALQGRPGVVKGALDQWRRKGEKDLRRALRTSFGLRRNLPTLRVSTYPVMKHFLSMPPLVCAGPQS